MENEAGPSRPKRPHQLVLGTEIEDLLLEEHDTDDDFIYESSSDDDDDDDDDDHSQPPTLQLPTHRRVSPVCEIESPSHQDFEETGPPSSSSDQLLSFYPWLSLNRSQHDAALPSTTPRQERKSSTDDSEPRHRTEVIADLRSRGARVERKTPRSP
ncbi:hypothetical protein EVAR_47589_1 [Eumeta japonica]|uniref:Uncharacterized protein n=1 Tax=Eumeta variegata TaxID=151549 RepID=A0A4C1WS46_EUMVA|nr:hypothetical protein EVAR_47589_1 [Eumeta japonica]